jgi:hypothetical protein
MSIVSDNISEPGDPEHAATDVGNRESCWKGCVVTERRAWQGRRWCCCWNPDVVESVRIPLAHHVLGGLVAENLKDKTGVAVSFVSQWTMTSFPRRCEVWIVALPSGC